MTLPNPNHPNPSPLRYELEDPCAIEGSVRVEVSLSACEGLVILCVGDVAPLTQEVGRAISVVVDVIVYAVEAVLC